MNELSFKLEVFEGPLDLLLSLVEKNKVDIYDIPIALIFEQYMEYIDTMRMMDMEVAGEFIVMAADLMLIKSKMLLPKQIDEDGVEEEDPRLKLARALEEYKKAKEAAKYLSDRYSVYGGRIAREEEVIDTRGDIPDHIDLDLLTKALNRVAEKNSRYPDMIKESEKAIQKLLEAKVVPVSSKIYSIMRFLKKNGPSDFDGILMTADCRSALIAIFVATLELLKVQRITMTANEEEHVILTLNTFHKRDEVSHV